MISQKKSVLWISSLVLDQDLHKTSRIEMLRNLSKRGYNVSLIGVRSKNRFSLKDFPILAIPLRRVPIISPLMLGIIFPLFLPFYIIIKKPKFIIVHPSIEALSLIWIPILSYFMKFKVILDIRSTPVGVYGLSGHLRALGFSISVHIAKLMFNGITIITPMMRNEVCKKYKIDPKSVGVMTDGVSTSLFKNEKYAHERLELRKKFGLSDKFVAIYHGALSRSRGCIEAIDAIAIARKQHPDIILFLLGSGEVHLLQKQISKNKLEDNVIIHDPVDYRDVPKYIAMSDVGVVVLPDIPDWRNQCPLKLLEYLAMKKPVILTDIAANREIVGDSKCAIYVPSCNPSKIADALEYAFDNRDRLKEWGEYGRAIVIKKYSWDKVVDDREEHLLSI